MGSMKSTTVHDQSCLDRMATFIYTFCCDLLVCNVSLSFFEGRKKQSA